MTKDKYKKIAMKASCWAAQTKLSNDADDLAQNAAIRIWSGRKTNVDSLCIDYARDEYGRSGTNPGKGAVEKSNLKRFFRELDDVADFQAKVSEPSFDFDNYRNKLKTSEDRTIVTLLCKWGLTLGEIGDCLGIGESRVSQKLTQIKKYMLKRIDSPNKDT